MALKDVKCDMMPFLYFPEDKMEYIPAVIALLIFMALAVAAMRWMMKKSRKEQEKFEQNYQAVLQQTKQNHNETNSSSS